MTPTEIARQRFAGKRVTVVGLAREGLALIRFLVGVGAEVAANDRAEGAALREAVDVLSALPVRLVLGGHPTELFLESDTVFISPGVPQQLPSLVEARARDVPVSSETQLFFELCPGRIVGITGSAGKTTTTALVGDMLRDAGMPLFVGGNTGVPLLDRLEEIGPDAWVVLEMSSFQLEALPCSPPVAAVLNVTPNHLDRHGDMESYAAAKANIVRHQRPGDLAVLNADDPVSAGMPAPGRQVWFSLERPVEGAHLEGEEIVLRHGGDSETVCAASEVHLRGRHNLANVVAASAIASAVGAPVGAMRVAIANFRGVPHRLEMVGEVGRVIFCNDSIATAPERSMASLRSFDRP
ncbi:MAG: UDP-N-acetylmuramoyl-L-alanine--D-glutamate ligase, partial [Actinobacteria bacterium]|nr:UDP-N-acetylmuramoyl-L-alanine--D-glutamate ligase [Actinomycetota bacterium]